MRILFGASILLLVYGAGRVALSEDLTQDWWVSGLLLALAILCAFYWPADLELSESGIYERKWLGLQMRRFAWRDVASAAPNLADDSIDLVTNSGITIRHTKYHVDRAAFVAQVKAHCRWLELGERL
jgi:hypothetical protein